MAEITLRARNAEIHPNFHEYIEEKIAKVEQLAPRTRRVDVELTHERNPRQVDTMERVEITVHDKDPMVHAEASSSNRYAAVDITAGKPYERLRRARDRVKNRRHYDIPPDIDLDVATPGPQAKPAPIRAPLKPGGVREDQLGDSPVTVCEELYETTPVSVEEALDEMELAGHPFYLFIDSETMQPAVIYRRQGWTYGVIRLSTNCTINQG